MPTKKKSGSSSALAKLPPALRARATALHDQAQARLSKAAHDALDRARSAHGDTRRGLYVFGLALVDLKRPGFTDVLGFKNGFYSLCESEFDLSRSSVDRLVTAVQNVSEEQYASLKPARVDALLSLAAATPEDDTDAILAGKRIVLWNGGPTLDIARANTAAIKAAAIKVRDQIGSSDKPRRGKSASSDERALVVTATKKLARHGIKAVVKVRATKPNAPSVFDVIGLTAAELTKLLPH